MGRSLQRLLKSLRLSSQLAHVISLVFETSSLLLGGFERVALHRGNRGKIILRPTFPGPEELMASTSEKVGEKTVKVNVYDPNALKTVLDDQAVQVCALLVPPTTRDVSVPPLNIILTLSFRNSASQCSTIKQKIQR